MNTCLSVLFKLHFDNLFVYFEKKKRERTVQVEVLCVYIGGCSNTLAITNVFVKYLSVYLFQLEHSIICLVCLFEF